MANRFVVAMAALAMLGTLAAPAWAQYPPPSQPPASTPPSGTPPSGDTTTVNVDQGPSFLGMSGAAFWVLVLVVVVVLALALFALAARGGAGHL